MVVLSKSQFLVHSYLSFSTDVWYRIDGLDVSTTGLFDLRGRLAIIPQDPAMFEGTLRDNLDPRHVHDDTELWSVLGMDILLFLRIFTMKQY